MGGQGMDFWLKTGRLGNKHASPVYCQESLVRAEEEIVNATQKHEFSFSKTLVI